MWSITSLGGNQIEITNKWLALTQSLGPIYVDDQNDIWPSYGSPSSNYIWTFTGVIPPLPTYGTLSVASFSTTLFLDDGSNCGFSCSTMNSNPTNWNFIPYDANYYSIYTADGSVALCMISYGGYRSGFFFSSFLFFSSYLSEN